MGKLYDSIDDDLRAFIEGQHLFFVATAPRGDDGHVNLSPKGLEGFAVLGPHQVAWADLTGSGVETIAHLRENGRITIMFCAFTGSPNIVRLYGTGRAVRPGDDEFDSLAAQFPAYKALRSVIVVDVTRISDSCGYGVPLMEFKADRRTLPAWADKKSPDEILEYQRTHNAESIDGLPGI